MLLAPVATQVYMLVMYFIQLHRSRNDYCVLCLVPADVFSLNSGWAGFYEYLEKRQAATVTVNAFNATTSRVNVTLLEQSGVHIKLSGKLEFSARFWHNVQWRH